MIANSIFIEAFGSVQQACYQNSVDHGFWENWEWNFGEKIALIHSEVSEALEKHRKTIGKALPDAPDEHCPDFGGVTIELADVLIRIMDLAGKMELPLAEAILAKMKFNAGRPKKHGKAY